MRNLILQTKILTDIKLGIYTYTDYYDNGDVVTREVPEGLILIPKFLRVF